MNSTLKDILQNKQQINEQRLSVVRLIVFSIVFLLDVFQYIGILKYNSIDPGATTLIIDCIFLSYGIMAVITSFKYKYWGWLKHLVITLDFGVMAAVLIFDTSVPSGESYVIWAIFVASIFFFVLNLLRYSLTGVIHAAILSLLFFIFISIAKGVINDPNFFSLLIPLLFILFIGYAVTSSNISMMEEASSRQMMERFLSPQLVEQLAKKTATIAPGGQFNVVTILFSDLRSFTSLSEKIPPYLVVNILNRYLSLMTDVIFSHEGTLDKFMGDGIMTIFGAPVSKNDDTLRALKTGIAMQKALNILNGELKGENLHTRTPLVNETVIPSLEMGIGIHRGEVIAGNIGSEKRLDFTVIGDTVNLASRIESITKFYKSAILVSGDILVDLGFESTLLMEPFHDFFLKLGCAIRMVDRVRVKGRETPLDLFEIKPLYGECDNNIIKTFKMYEEAFALYLSGDYSSAEKSFKEINGDETSLILAQRCKKIVSQGLPPGWDGAYSMENK